MQCPFCKEEILDGAIKCKYCKTFLTKENHAEEKEPEPDENVSSSSNNNSDAIPFVATEPSLDVAKVMGPDNAQVDTSPPPLAILFFGFSILGLVGGIILATQLWPGDPMPGYSWKMIAYIPSITWIAIAVVQSALFAAIGQILIYLKDIAENTKQKSDEKS